MSTNTKLEKAKEKLGNLKEYIDSHKPATDAIPECVEQLRPSTSSGKIKYFNRINRKIKQKFQEHQTTANVLELKNKGPTGSGTETGKVWDRIISEYLDGSSKKEDERKIAKGVINAVKDEFEGIEFLQSKFPLYGYMTRMGDASEISFWNGTADAVGWYEDNYVIVEWKVVDLLEFWEKHRHAYGDYLHQSLVYAKLLKLHLELRKLPHILIVPISNTTGKQITPGLFYDFPDECKEELDQYKWSKKRESEPKKLRLPSNLAKGDIEVGLVEGGKEVREVLKNGCTVADLLDALGYDQLEIIPSK